MSILNVKKKNSGEKDNLSDYNDDSKRMEMDRGDWTAVALVHWVTATYFVPKDFWHIFVVKNWKIPKVYHAEHGALPQRASLYSC